MKKVLAFAALALLATSANATVWTITGGGLTTWFTNGTNGSSLQNIYESGFGTSAEAPSPRVSSYACYGLAAPSDTSCEIDENGEGVQADLWGSAASYSGTIDDAAITGTISWTGTTGTGAAAGAELFGSSITSGSYDIAAGSSPTGTFRCWNNPDAVATYGANFCGNTTGGAVLTTASPQSLGSRALPNGMVSFTDNGNGVITVVLSDTTYSSCTAANPLTCGSNSSDTFAIWNFTATSAIPVPAAVWLFGSALGLLGWVRRRASV